MVELRLFGFPGAIWNTQRTYAPRPGNLWRDDNPASSQMHDADQAV